MKRPLQGAAVAHLTVAMHAVALIVALDLLILAATPVIAGGTKNLLMRRYSGRVVLLLAAAPVGWVLVSWLVGLLT